MIAAAAPTTLWAREPEVVEAVNVEHVNPLFLPGLALTPTLRATADLGEALAGADAAVLVVPSTFVRSVLRDAAPHLRPELPLLSVVKGLEQGSNLRMTEVVAEEIGTEPDRLGVLTGPNLAREIAAGQPAATVIALPDEVRARELQALVAGPTFRVYTNPDVIGCEISGCVKNVIALGAGMAHGLGLGDNTKAALITRGLAELARLGIALGGRPLTFLGLAGNGDLIATCSSEQSRNRHVGTELGRGRPLDEIVAEMNMVAEGVKTAPAIRELAARHDVEMPIVDAVDAVLRGEATPTQVLVELMERPSKSELLGLV
jgi:glycerol-3-phosphate dehydrogenase (NAD(P)+)